jgi:hypothetical protein
MIITTRANGSIRVPPKDMVGITALEQIPNEYAVIDGNPQFLHLFELITTIGNIPFEGSLDEIVPIYNQLNNLIHGK